MQFIKVMVLPCLSRHIALVTLVRTFPTDNSQMFLQTQAKHLQPSWAASQKTPLKRELLTLVPPQQPRKLCPQLAGGAYPVPTPGGEDKISASKHSPGNRRRENSPQPAATWSCGHPRQGAVAVFVAIAMPIRIPKPS